MKKQVNFFTSYAHSDLTIASKLLNLVDANFKSSSTLAITRWIDHDIVLGSEWEDQISNAISNSNFGLFLISPSFLASEYITKKEIGRYITADGKLTGARQVIPVALSPIDLTTMDLHGLQKRQIFFKDGRSFMECRSLALKHSFALELYKQIVRLIGQNEA